MSNKQVIKYVKNLIINNLAKNECWEEIFFIKEDKTNETLLAHINGLIVLFVKAKEILEKKGGKDE